MRDVRLQLVSFALVAGLLASWGCAQQRDNFRRAEDHYAAARYDAAERWWTEMEPEVGGMSLELRTRFYYLRGMTAYRLQKRWDARHYLAIARELNGDQGALLGSSWTETLQRTLTELNVDEGAGAPGEGGGGSPDDEGGSEAPGASTDERRRGASDDEDGFGD
ncbi:MAG: hypothetical protein IT379_42660 [Deltaproteobacteria bacterium]|nr:hypothetical protein [Deltaproteobacteria bacterium]